MQRENDMANKYWLGPVTTDQVTGDEFNGAVYDARVSNGQWGLICQQTFDAMGCKLGLGRGQKYEQQADGRWLLVEGGQ